MSAAFFLLFALAHATSESDLTLCSKDSDCIIVPYKHCCGSTKRAINKKYKELYEKTPEWQRYGKPNCAVMGACMPDRNLKKTVCLSGRCQL